MSRKTQTKRPGPCTAYTQDLFLILLLAANINSYSQNNNDGIKTYRATIQGNTQGWQRTGIQIKKGESVLIETTKKITYGIWIGASDASGFRDPFLIKTYNLPEFPSNNHGALISRNGAGFSYAVTGMILLAAQYQNRIQLPEKFLSRIKSSAFVGNFFVCEEDMDLSFIINDKKTSDNKGSFEVTVHILRFCPELSGLFDFADLVEQKGGTLDFCFRDNCGSQLNSDYGYYEGGRRGDGHYYLAINPIGNSGKSAAEAMAILVNRIYDIFPGGAVDHAHKTDPEKSKIELGHTYSLTKLLPKPVVKVTSVRPYYFIFEATPDHILKGTAIHGVFIDKCGDLYMFQQGRGMPEEWKIMQGGNVLVAQYMWKWMADNIKPLL